MEGGAMIVDPYAPFRDEVRRRWYRMTAFRLGIVIGESDRHLPCPYDTDRGIDSFAQGLAYGREKRGKRGES